MTSKNKTSHIGNLTADPDLRTTGNGTPVCNVRLVCNEPVKRGEVWEKETVFIDIAIWGTRGEAFARFHKKGDLAAIDGKLRLDEWVDKNTQAKRSQLKIIGTEWFFVGDRKSAPEAGAAEPAF